MSGTYTATVTAFDGEGGAVSGSVTVVVRDPNEDNDLDGVNDDGDPDADNDGISDQDEQDGGTNSFDPDSKPGGDADADGDGMIDDQDSDSDRDGVSDANEVANGSDPFEASSFTKLPFEILKLKARFRFGMKGRDKCMLSGALSAVPANVEIEGAEVDIDVGGAQYAFTLDHRRRSKATHGTLGMKSKPL